MYLYMALSLSFIGWPGCCFLSQGCLRFRGAARSMDVGKILQDQPLGLSPVKGALTRGPRVPFKGLLPRSLKGIWGPVMATLG